MLLKVLQRYMFLKNLVCIDRSYKVDNEEDSIRLTR